MAQEKLEVLQLARMKIGENRLYFYICVKILLRNPSYIFPQIFFSEYKIYPARTPLAQALLL